MTILSHSYIVYLQCMCIIAKNHMMLLVIEGALFVSFMPVQLKLCLFYIHIKHICVIAILRMILFTHCLHGIRLKYRIFNRFKVYSILPV